MLSGQVIRGSSTWRTILVRFSSSAASSILSNSCLRRQSMVCATEYKRFFRSKLFPKGLWKGNLYTYHKCRHLLNSDPRNRSVIWPCFVRHSCDNTHRDTECKDTDVASERDLCNKIVHKDDNLIAINKPAGLSVHGSSTQTETSRCVERAFPYISEKYDCPHLEVGLSLKSFYSGLILLCKTTASKTQLEKFLAGTAAQKKQFMSYLAITVGVPQCPHGIGLVASIYRDFLHNREMSIVSDKNIQSARKAGAMMQTCFTVKPMAVNRDLGVALVEVSINKDKWEAVEVLMSQYLSPVLGDHIYSSRTHTVMGVPFLASAHSAVPGPQRLPAGVKGVLKSSGILTEERPMPLCVHRHKVTLSKFPHAMSPSLTIEAKPQEEFLAVLQCLGLYRQTMFS